MSCSGSILGDDRAAPAIVDADGDEIDVLLDALVEGQASSTNHAIGGEGVGAVAHEQVVVLDRRRPVRGEAEFEACTHRAAPAGVGSGVGGEDVRTNGVAAE